LAHFWESKMDGQMIANIQGDWYRVLQDHSLKTIDAVVLEWLSIGKRKPTPADILELCNETDSTPSQLNRFRKMYDLPVKEPVQVSPEEKEPPMLGCPIRLATLMRQAEKYGQSFGEGYQTKYLRDGIEPRWATVDQAKIRTDMPSREELLAHMPPEARVAAIKHESDWKRD
jgi:hypothetical protein